MDTTRVFQDGQNLAETPKKAQPEPTWPRPSKPPEQPHIDIDAVWGVVICQVEYLRDLLQAWPHPDAKAAIGNMQPMLCDGLRRLAGEVAA